MGPLELCDQEIGLLSVKQIGTLLQGSRGFPNLQIVESLSVIITVNEMNDKMFDFLRQQFNGQPVN